MCARAPERAREWKGMDRIYSLYSFYSFYSNYSFL